MPGRLFGLHAITRATALAGAALLVGAFAIPATAFAAPATQVLEGQVVPGLSAAADMGAAPRDMRVDVAVAFTHDRAAIDALNAQLHDPASASYKHWLTAAQWQARFAAPAASVEAVRSYVEAGGLAVDNAGATGDMVVATGTVADAERTFKTSIHLFSAADGRVYYANVKPATVPGGLGIDTVIGLEDYHQLHTFNRGGQVAQQGGCAGPICTGLMSPQDLWTAYNLPGDNLGEGESVGIIGEGRTDNVIAALREFEKTRGLTFVPAQVYRVLPGGDSAYNDDAGRVEWEMDSQSSTGMAPRVSKVEFYFGTSLAVTTLAVSLQTWANDVAGPRQASASLGLCESNPAVDSLLGGAQRASSDALAQAASLGRTFFASAGDTGAGCAVGPTAVNGVTYGPVPDAEFPAVDPNAVAVGGTVIYMSADGKSRADEHVWTHTGGTPSHFVPQPTYQSGVALLQSNRCAADAQGHPNTTTLCRGTADVSALSGDGTIVVDHKTGGTPAAGLVPANGFDMVDYDGKAYQDHFSEGGTSLSSPLWLGMWARIAAAQATPAGGTATMYTTSAKKASAFNDIIEGANPLPALPGYDYPSGLGTPNVTAFTTALTGGNTAPARPASPGSADLPMITAGQLVTCATFADARGDQSFLGDPTYDTSKLDITQGDLALTADQSTLRTVLTLTNASTDIPNGDTETDFDIWFGKGDGTFPALQVYIDSTGIQYNAGTLNASTVQGTTNYTFTKTKTESGVFKAGKNGSFEIDAPLADLGLKLGDTLPAPQAYSAASGPGFGLIADQAGPGPDYKIGTSTSCLNAPPAGDLPEVPVAAALPAVGFLAIGGLLLAARRRRAGA